LTLIADILDVPATELAEINPASLARLVPVGYPLNVPTGAAIRWSRRFSVSCESTGRDGGCSGERQARRWRCHRTQSDKSAPSKKSWR